MRSQAPLAPHPIPLPTLTFLDLLTQHTSTLPRLQDLETLRSELNILRSNVIDRKAKLDSDQRALEERHQKLRAERRAEREHQLQQLQLQAANVAAAQASATAAESAAAAQGQAASMVPPVLPPGPGPGKAKKKGRVGTETPEPDAERRGSFVEPNRSKKKRKREEDELGAGSPDGLVAGGHAKARLYSPPHQPVKLKLSSAKPRRATVFDLPTEPPLPAAPHSVPLPATAKNQADVDEDFTDRKPGNQIQITSFYAAVEGYLRPLGEDDLMFLSAKGDDITPYIHPPLGRPYLSVWEDEDVGLTPQPIPPATTARPPALPRFAPQELTEDQLAGEEAHLGPVSERLVAAFAAPGAADADPWDGLGWEGIQQERMDVEDLEVRIKRELRFIGVLGESEETPTHPPDDAISHQLSQLQHLLRAQSEINTSRRSRLLSLARDRLAAQEYTSALTDLEKVIEAGWMKRQKQIARIKKKNGGRLEGGGAGEVGEGVRRALERRERWIEEVGGRLEEEERRDPGRFWGVREEDVQGGGKGEREVEVKVEEGLLGLEGARAGS